MVLDVPNELVFPGMRCVGTITHLTLPVLSRSATAVSVVVRIDSVTVEGRNCGTDDRSFLVTQQSFLLNVASCHDVQVLIFMYLINSA